MISAYPFCFRQAHRPIGALYLLFTLKGPLIYNSSFTVDVISSWAILTVNLRYVVPDNSEYYSFNVPHFSKQSVPITDTTHSLNNFWLNLFNKNIKCAFINVYDLNFHSQIFMNIYTFLTN